MLCAVPRSEINQCQWDDFVDASPDAWLYHHSAFINAKNTWKSYQKDISFAVVDHLSGSTMEILAVMPLHVIKGRALRLFPWIALHSVGGFAFLNGIGDHHRKKVLKFIREEVDRIATRHKAVTLEVVLSPQAPTYRSEFCPLVNPLLDLGFENTLTQLVAINLSSSLKSIRSSYRKSTRWELRKIQENGVHVREARGEDDLRTYYDLHCETCKRTGVDAPHPFEYFEAIFNKFIPEGLSRVVFCEVDGEVVAAQNTALYKGAAFYWTGASADEKLGGENRLLMDNQIAYAHAQGFEWYYPGEVFPGAADSKLKGLSDYKSGFGGEHFPWYQGRQVYQKKLVGLFQFYKILVS